MPRRAPSRRPASHQSGRKSEPNWLAANPMAAMAKHNQDAMKIQYETCAPPDLLADLIQEVVTLGGGVIASSSASARFFRSASWISRLGSRASIGVKWIDTSGGMFPGA